MSSFHANVVGNVHLFNLFLPLIQKGQAKKVITITSGMADIDFIANFNIASAAPYSISKAAMNAAVAKFSAQYRKDGILFLGLSPGLVNTSENTNRKLHSTADWAMLMMRCSDTGTS
jgi:NAD(P)-dependent dehydrogenase (short-subunit alcohol dehydrogenase family)